MTRDPEADADSVVDDYEKGVLRVKEEDLTNGEHRDIGGAGCDGWNQAVINQAIQSIWAGHFDTAQKAEARVSIVGALLGIRPNDEIEGMLAAQMIGAHNAAMECYRRAMLAEQTFEGREQNLKHAAKLSRTFAQLQATLDKHRGKGQQKVTVEHVHVHEGGQAIVGNVEAAGGGVKGKSAEQPHASAPTDADGAEMRREDQARDALPGPSDGERPLSHAWGQEPRRAEGEPERVEARSLHGASDRLAAGDE